MALNPDADDAPAQEKAKILLVDDQPANLLALRAILDELGQNLVDACSGEEALRRVQTDEFAVILLDVLMPGISGYETARRIRSSERSRHTPIIFLTANDIDRPQLEEAYILGAVDFLVKPLLPVALQAKVRGFVELFQEKQRARREAEQLRLLVHGTKDYAIFLLDPKGHIVTWNPGAERLKGYKADEIIGQHFSRFYPPDVIARGWPQHELKVAAAEGRFEDEGWRLRKDGSRFWANVVITALRDERDNLRGFSKVTRDMTERKAAEENARRLVEEETARRVAEEDARLIEEQREHLRVTLASIGDAVISTDADGRVTFLNPVAESLVGWKTEEAARRGLSDVFRVINEKTRQPVENPALRALRDGTIVGLANHTVLISKDGTERPIDDSAAPIRDAEGNAIGSVLVFRDVSERRRTEQAIQQSEARKSAILETALDCIITLDHEGKVIEFNPAAERTFGYRREQVIGRDLADFIIPYHLRALHRQGFARYLATGEGPMLGKRIELSALHADGTESPIELAITCIRTDGPPLFTAYLRDISERVRVEQQRNARLAVTQVLAHAASVDEAAGGVLQAVGDSLGWDVGFFWMVNEAGTALDCTTSWHRSDVLVEFFEKASCSRTFEKGQGLPGRVWADGQPAWILDINQDPNFPRLDAAVNRGLHSAFACPLAIDSHTVGVIEFFTKRIREPDADLLEMMGTIAGNVAQFIERKSAEEELRRSEQRLAAELIERLGYEEALSRSEAQFRQLADTMAQIVWTAEADGNIDYLNHRWTEYTGLPQTVNSDAWGQILHPDDAQTARERWAVCMKSGDTFDMEVRLLDGHRQTYRWHLIRTVAIRDEAGRVARWFGTGTDIHEQKRAEESARYLAEASASLAVVLDYESTLQKVANLAVPYFADWSAVDVANEDGSLRRLAVAHHDAEKIQLAHELHRHYPPDLQAAGGIGAVFRTGKPEILQELTDELLVRGAKDERHLRLMRSLGLKSYICVPLVASGASLGVLTFATAESGRTYNEADLSLAMDLANRAAVAVENTRLYQALREADRRKDEFLATLAHELRNPLAPIRNSLQILKMPRVDTETAGRSREMMERQVQQLVRLVDDLLDVSRVMRGKITLHRERVELASIIARAVETAQPLIETQGHQFSVRLAPESLPLDADPVRLAQVVGNLLTNAAKYTEPNGRIWLTAERDGNMAVLRVRDSGIGIAPDMLRRIFELFVQVDHAATKSQGGLGIGLTLVKNLVEMHNGTVEARSAGLGEGSEFIVRLPLSAQQLDQGQDRELRQQAPEPPSPSGYRVLVVDDNQDAANSLAMLLRLQGHEVRVAYSGMAALEMTTAYLPDVVFLDIGMPGMDGYEVARRLRQQPGREDIVLAALTGWGQQEDRRRTAEAGFNYHLVKPPEPQALEEVFAGLSDDAKK